MRCPALRLEAPVEHPSPAGDQGFASVRAFAWFEHPQRPCGGARRRDGAPRDRAADLFVGNQHQTQGREEAAVPRDEVERTYESDDAALHVDGPGRPKPVALEAGRRGREHGVEVPDQEDGEGLRRGRRRALWRARRGRCRARRIDDRQRPAVLVGLEPDRHLEAAGSELAGEGLCHPVERRRVVAGELAAARRVSSATASSKSSSGRTAWTCSRDSRGVDMAPSLPPGRRSLAWRGRSPVSPCLGSGRPRTLTRRLDSAGVGRTMTRSRMEGGRRARARTRAACGQGAALHASSPSAPASGRRRLRRPWCTPPGFPKRPCRRDGPPCQPRGKWSTRWRRSIPRW